MTEKALTPQMDKFCWHYASIDSESWNHKGQSAELAGYKSPANSATQLVKNPAIQVRIREIEKENVSEHRGKALSRFEYIFNKAISLTRPDLSNANLAAKHIAQMLGFLREADIEPEERQKMSEQQVKEAEEFTKWRLLQSLNEPQQDQEVEEFAEVGAN